MTFTNKAPKALMLDLSTARFVKDRSGMLLIAPPLTVRGRPATRPLAVAMAIAMAVADGDAIAPTSADAEVN